MVNIIVNMDITGLLTNLSCSVSSDNSCFFLATVQAYFRLEKPVSDLVPNIARLEYDIYGEIGVPSTKVCIIC